MSDNNITSDIEGKKVFFLYPTASVKNHIIEELVQQEYEVYISKNHKNLAQALKKYSDSIVYVNIDEAMSKEEWEKWVGAMKDNLPNVRVGIFSSIVDDDLRDKFLNYQHVACGFMNSKTDMEKNTAKILDVHKVMKVKGRRKYIRASTKSENTATINIPFNGKYINGTIKDISVIGISCTLDQLYELKKNTLLTNIQIRLQSMLLKVDAVLLGSRMDGPEKIYVMLFTQRLDTELQSKIRKYIQNNLQSKMDSEIN